MDEKFNDNIVRDARNISAVFNTTEQWINLNDLCLFLCPFPIAKYNIITEYKRKTLISPYLPESYD
jgi:hypothetical protein